MLPDTLVGAGVEVFTTVGVADGNRVGVRVTVGVAPPGVEVLGL